jgi:hypothetical protein
MRRVNRKRNDPTQRLPMTVLIGVSLVMLTGILYVGIKTHTEMLGAEIRRLESELELNRRRLQAEEFRWAELMTPRRIEEAMAKHGLDLTWPHRQQVVRLYDSRAPDLTWVDLREAAHYARLEQIARNE